MISAKAPSTARRRRNYLEVSKSCMAKVTRVSTLSMGQRKPLQIGSHFNSHLKPTRSPANCHLRIIRRGTGVNVFTTARHSTVNLQFAQLFLVQRVRMGLRFELGQRRRLRMDVLVLVSPAAQHRVNRK